MSSIQQYNPGVAELGRKNQPNGYVGIDENGDVFGTFAQRVGTAAEIAEIVLASGELAYTSDTEELFIGDGATAGGLFFYQKPQTQQRTWSDGLPLPNFASIDPETTIVFPKELGATYRLTFDADFTAGSDNLSNFSVRVFCNGALASLYTGTNPSIISTDWFDLTSGSLLERISQRISLSDASSDFGVACVMKVAGNLTRSTAGLRASTVIKPLTELGTPRNYILVQPVYRTGGTSPATAAVTATWQRIA